MKVRCTMVDAFALDLSESRVYEVIKHDVVKGYYWVKDDCGEMNFMKYDECEFLEEGDVEWNGKGRPPVGTVCEVSIDNQEYREVEIVAYFDKTRSVIIYEAPWTPEVYEWDYCKFRPIKSEKDKSIEELEIYINMWHNNTSEDRKPLEEYLYEVGYRKAGG